MTFLLEAKGMTKRFGGLVAVNNVSFGVGAKEINRRLKQIANDTTLDEIWITDEKGHAYLRNIAEVDFTFSPDREKQPKRTPSGLCSQEKTKASSRKRASFFSFMCSRTRMEKNRSRETSNKMPERCSSRDRISESSCSLTTAPVAFSSI